MTDLQRLTDQLKALNPELVIAVGGGSVIDVAKAAAAIARNEGTCADHFFGRVAITNPSIPFIALPTTAGTGAEITKNSVIIDGETRIKQSIRSPLMIPLAAICDAELTVTMPPGVTAFSGLDALTQAVEAYLTAKGTNATRALALKAVQLILPNLETAVSRPDDRDARSAMCEASLLTAMSFSQSGLGAVHGIAHPLGSLLNVPHGKCCAVLLPHILKFNAPVCEEPLGELAVATGFGTAKEFVEEIIRICRELGIPANFREYGLNDTHFPFIIEKCRSNSMSGNPRPMSDEEVAELLADLI